MEKLLNTMTAFLELKRITPLLQKAVEDKNLDQCISYLKIQQSFQHFLIPEFA